MGWLEDLLGLGESTQTFDGLLDSPISAGTISNLEPMNFESYGNLFGESGGATISPQEELFAGRDSVWMPSFAAEPSFWQQASDFYAPIDKAISSPLGKLGVGGLGALVSYYGANKQNELMRKAREEALARAAMQRAQHATDTAPMRFTNQRATLPSWGAANRNAFSGNSLAAMTPRSTSTMYAASGGVARGTGGLGQMTGLSGYVNGGTAGQDDSVPAMLSDGEYIFDADTVSALGDGNNAAGAAALDQMRMNIRRHKRKAPANKIPPKAKSPEAYMKGAKQ